LSDFVTLSTLIVSIAILCMVTTPHPHRLTYRHEMRPGYHNRRCESDNLSVSRFLVATCFISTFISGTRTVENSMVPSTLASMNRDCYILNLAHNPTNCTSLTRTELEAMTHRRDVQKKLIPWRRLRSTAESNYAIHFREAR